MLLHEVATKRGGKSSAVRLSQADWNTECDRCCVIGYVLESMESALNQDGNELFSGSILESVDYTADADSALGCLDQSFRPEETTIYKEHMPEQMDQVAEQLKTVDSKVSSFNQEARLAMYQADTLSLAHDLAQIGNVYSAIAKSEHARKTEKVLHLKSQNTIGAAIVAEFMASNMSIGSGVLRDQISLAERVRDGANTFYAHDSSQTRRLKFDYSLSLYDKAVRLPN
eukprot:s619_g30.t1